MVAPGASLGNAEEYRRSSPRRGRKKRMLFPPKGKRRSAIFIAECLNSKLASHFTHGVAELRARPARHRVFLDFTMSPAGLRTRWILVCALALLTAAAQQPDAASRPLDESGHVMIEGRNVPYLIRHLPVNAFPDLPAPVADQLNQRQCLIPQSYEAHHPENVVHASLEHVASTDWAVLCSANGRVSLLVFLGSAGHKPSVLATATETARLQRHDSSGVLGFNWAIEPASPEAVHQAQSSMEKRPPRLDHDTLADITLDRNTVYRFFKKGSWTLVDTSD